MKEFESAVNNDIEVVHLYPATGTSEAVPFATGLDMNASSRGFYMASKPPSKHRS